MESRDRAPTCCEVIGIFFYSLFRIFIIVCPVVAQIRCIYILCKPEDYLKSPDQCTRAMSHVELFVGFYGVFYLIGYSVYSLFNFLQDNWNNEAEPCKMHTAQLIGGLIVFKVYYELWRLGHRWIYAEDANCCSEFAGTILLTILTIGLFLVYRYFEVTIHYWNSEDSCKRETVRFVAGLGVFYCYYHLWRIGIQKLYRPEADCGDKTLGTFLLTLVTVGLFIPFRIIEVICRNWNNPDPCARETVRFIGGLGIFYLYYQLWHYGLRFTYRSDDSGCKQFTGHLMLILATLGLFIPFRILELICRNWNHEDRCIRQTVRFIGGLGIFYLYYQLWNYGIRWTYREDESCGKQFMGHIYLTLATVGLFVPFRIIQSIYCNWNSEVVWKRELARCVGLLVVFYLWYKMASTGYRSVYRSDAEEVEHRAQFHEFFGHILLILSTFGGYIFYKPFELIVVHWFDENACKRETARFFGGMGIFYLYYQLFYHGILWVYRENDNTCKFITGNFFLVLTSFGIYIPYRIVELIVTKWYDPNVCYRETARFTGTLFIGYMWYRMFVQGYGWVYRDSNGCQTFVGYLFLTLTTLGLFIPVQLFIKGKEHIYHSDNTCVQICGHIELTIATAGLFLIYRFFQVVCNNWNSESECKKYTVRAIVGLVVIYLWITGLIWAYYMIYRQDGLCRKVAGRFVMTVCTFGLYIPVMMVEYVVYMCRCLAENYFLSDDYITGVWMACLPTAGLFGLFTLVRMENRWARYSGNLILTAMNAAGVYYLYTLVILKLNLQYQYKLGILVALCIASYPSFKFAAEFLFFNAIIRKMFSTIWEGLVYGGRAFRFCMAKIYYPLYVSRIAISNRLSKWGAAMRTFGSRIYARSANRRWIWTGYYFRIDRLRPQDAGYYEPRVHQPTIREPEPFVGWDEREAVRRSNPKHVLDEKRKNHQYVMDCVAANIQFNFNRVLHKFSRASIQLWYDRYTELRDTLAIKAFYQRYVDVSLDNPENWRRVDAVIYRLKIRRKEIVDEPIEYFNHVETGGVFEISEV